MAAYGLDYALLRAQLNLKLGEGDPTYQTEVEQLTTLLADSPDATQYADNLGHDLVRLATEQPNQMELVCDVARQTDWIPEALLQLEQELNALDGARSDALTGGLRAILDQPFPANASQLSGERFYSRCLNLAIIAGDFTLLRDAIEIVNVYRQGVAA